jgi:hypothetical protein
MDTEQRNAQLGDRLVESLLQINKMLYKMPPSLGITNRRNHRTDYFQQATYTNGEVMVLDSQVGTDFVDPKNSYIKMTIKPNADADFDTGSCANVINRVLVRTRTGKEICRLENANLITKFLQTYACPKDWETTVGKSQGYNAGAATVPAAGKVFILPLWVIPCFNVDKLLPPQMTTGLRMEITLETPSTALKASPAITSYTVERPELHLDTHDLADQFKRKISEMASSQGLNIVHKEYFHSIITSGVTDSYNFDVKKSASKALRLDVISRTAADVVDGTVDSLAAEDYAWTRWQAHIGADYFPNQALTVDDVAETGNAEAYYATLFAHGKTNQCWNPPSVDPTSYTTGGDGMISFNFNKSSVSELQGYQVNNSRAVLVDLVADTSSNRRIDAYLCFLRAAKYFTSNAEVRD